MFSINDFDETLPGPFEWDVKRLVASFAVAGRDRGLSAKQREAVNLTVAQAYREGIKRYAAMRSLDLWYSRLDVDELLGELRRQAKAKDAKVLDRRRQRRQGPHEGQHESIRKADRGGRRQLRIVGDPPLITPVEDVYTGLEVEQIEEFLRLVIRSYRRTLAGDRRKLLERFHYVHGARKVVGVGSVGTRAWICLMLGRDDDDPLFLQFKEAQQSVLEPFLGHSEFANSGQRVVEGQRLTQAASDIMLGWIKVDAPDGVQRDFYIRQLWDAKMSALVDVMEPRTMLAYARVCGTELARAHARAGDGVAIASYLGQSDTFDRAMARFAETYADQNERDYAALKAAVDSNRVEAALGSHVGLAGLADRSGMEKEMSANDTTASEVRDSLSW